MEFICKGMLAIRDPETGRFKDALDLYVKAEDAEHMRPEYERAINGRIYSRAVFKTTKRKAG